MPFRPLAYLAALVPAAALAQAPIAEAPGPERVSAQPAGEVHLVVDPALSDKRLSMRIVVLNRSTQPHPFGPEAIAVTVAGKPLKIASRAALLGASEDDTLVNANRAPAGAAMPTNGAGQTDVSGFNGGMGMATGGIPNDRVNRAPRKEDPQLAAALDAALLRSATVAPGKTAAGQVFSDRLRGRAKQVEIDVSFAGEHHRFAVEVPK